MRGKKQNRTRPSKRQLRREQHEKPPEPAHRTNAIPLSTEDIRRDLLSRYAAPIPRRVGTDFSFVEFADKVETEMIVNVVKCPSTVSTRRPSTQTNSTSLNLCNPHHLPPALPRSLLSHVRVRPGPPLPHSPGRTPVAYHHLRGRLLH
jgi:hypothetical protein